MPSLTLLGQAVVSGLLAGGIYGLLALGLSLSWGLLRLVNLAHFALALLGAYLTYQLGHVLHVPPWIAVAMVVPPLGQSAGDASATGSPAPVWRAEPGSAARSRRTSGTGRAPSR